MGTPPREFRIGIEVLLQHFENRGAKDFRLAMPVAAEEYKDRLKLFEERLNKIAYIYNVNQVIRTEKYLDSEFWSAGSKGQVERRTPTRAAIQPLANFLVAEGLQSK